MNSEANCLSVKLGAAGNDSGVMEKGKASQIGMHICGAVHISFNALIKTYAGSKGKGLATIESSLLVSPGRGVWEL